MYVIIKRIYILGWVGLGWVGLRYDHIIYDETCNNSNLDCNLVHKFNLNI